MKKRQQNEYLQTRKKYSATFKYFFKVLAIAFVPILIIDVLLSALLKGDHEWVIWVVTFIGLVIAGIIGLIIESKKAKQYLEQENKKKGKAVPKIEDIDVFGE